MAFGMYLRIGDVRHICSWIVLLAAMNKGVYGQDCFFRHDLCGWSNGGDVDWTQKSMATSSGTEHCAEVPLVNDTHASQRQAVLTSMTQPHHMSVLGFFYRLRAPNTLTVTAELDASGTQTPLWTVIGTEADTAWIEVDVLVPESSHFKISFQAGIPENSSSVVALTNITLRVGDDQCASMPCLNGGFCIDGNNSFTCVCSSGFKGEMCQIDMNAPPPKSTTLPPTTTTKATTPPPIISTRPPPKGTTGAKTAPSSGATVKYASLSPAPSRAPVVDPGPQTGGSFLDDPAMVVALAAGGVLVLTAMVTAVWALLYCKKRSWRPRYHERGLSMESVSHSESMQGKWTSTVDIAGSVPANSGSLPDLKAGLTPVEENHIPRKVENIYVTQHALGIPNNGYNIDHMY